MPIDLKSAIALAGNDRKRREALGLFHDEGGYKWFNMREDGEYDIRVLEWHPDMMAGSHWNVLEGKEGKKGASVRCPKVYDMRNACPICEKVIELSKSDHPDDRTYAKALQVKITYPMIVLDLNEQSDQIIPRIFESTKTVWDEVLNWSKNPRYGDVTDYETGRGLTVSRDKNRKPKMYVVMPHPDRQAIDLTGIDLPDLKVALKPRSYDDLANALLTGELPPLPKDEQQKPRQARPVQRTIQSRPPAIAPKPSAYSAGLPATKTQDEEYDDQPQEEAPAPRAPARRVQAAPPAPQPVARRPQAALREPEEYMDDQTAEEPVYEDEPQAPAARSAPRAPASAPAQRPLSGPSQANANLRDRLKSATKTAPR